MKHDESTDVKRLQRVGCAIRTEATATGTVKCIVAPIGLGIKSLGRIDYLTKYCHYRITYVNNRSEIKLADTKSIREIKKAKKTPKLTNKKK